MQELYLNNNQLRIGNYVKISSDWPWPWPKTRIAVVTAENISDLKNIQPLRVGRKLLTKVGFEPCPHAANEKNLFTLNDSFDIFIDDKFDLCEMNINTDNVKAKIKSRSLHLHQIQNIFYDLTTLELPLLWM